MNAIKKLQGKDRVKHSMVVYILHTPLSRKSYFLFFNSCFSISSDSLIVNKIVNKKTEEKIKTNLE